MSARGKGGKGLGKGGAYEQFLHLPQCFQKSSAAEASESIYMKESVKHIMSYFNG